MTMAQQSRPFTSFKETFHEWEILEQDKRFEHLDTYIQTSTENFYSGNDKRMQARRVLNKAKAIYNNEALTRVSDLVLPLVDLIPESKYRDLFIFVRSCIVGDFLTDVRRVYMNIDRNKFTSFLLDQLQYLFHNVISENREATIAFLKVFSDSGWCASELARIENVAQRDEAYHGLQLVATLLSQEISIIWTVDYSSENVVFGQALIELQKTSMFLHRRKNRFGISIGTIEGLCDIDCRSLLVDYLMEVKTQCMENDESFSVSLRVVDGILDRWYQQKIEVLELWQELEPAIMQLHTETPEGAVCHNAIFAMARICYIKHIFHRLQFGIIPYIEMNLPASPTLSMLKQLYFDLKLGNGPGINNWLCSYSPEEILQIGDGGKTIVRSSYEVFYLLWYIVPILQGVNCGSQNEDIKESMAVLWDGLNNVQVDLKSNLH